MMNEKSVYQQQLRKHLSEWDKQISQLKYKADHAPDYDAKAEYNGQVGEIHDLQQSLREKLHELEHSQLHVWEHLKDEVKVIVEKLEVAIKKLAALFD